MEKRHVKVTRTPGIIRRAWCWSWEPNQTEYRYECSWRPFPSDHRRVKQMRIVERNSRFMSRKAVNHLPSYDMGYYYSD